MSYFQNIIITISGEPASGKSRAVSELQKQYESMGYEVEVKLIGKEYRPIIMEEYSRYLDAHPEIPRKAELSLADAQADPGFSHIIRRKLDTWLDNRTEAYGKKISSQYTPNKVYIIDARLAWQRIPNSFAVRTVVDEVVAGLRAYDDESRGPEDSYPDPESAIEATKKRRDGEIQRYIERYGIDLTDPTHYNLVLDTTHLTPEEVAKKIIEAEREYREEQRQAKQEAGDGR